ncbi:MAG TPA: RecX family transcriptional regulator [Gaiellaceae bacterium]|nr:RecX family transcriptional regulator [Gaiellaceae bacterium]
MAARLTELRRSRPGRVALEVDGRPWRTVPDEVVVRCGLAAGMELRRPQLRDIRRALREAEALEAAVRALVRRDLSRSRLDERLRARGVAPGERERAVALCSEAGYVDDVRAARRRAGALCERGWGDAAVEERLAAEGFSAEAARAALAELPPESERAAAAAGRVGDRRKAWSRLARRGFSADAIEAAVGVLDEDGAGGLG